jgi:hypothetical protein
VEVDAGEAQPFRALDDGPGGAVQTEVTVLAIPRPESGAMRVRARDTESLAGSARQAHVRGGCGAFRPARNAEFRDLSDFESGFDDFPDVDGWGFGFGT